MQHDSRETTQVAYGQPRVVMDLSLDARAQFILRVFTHLLGALVAFTLIEVGLFWSGLATPIANAMLGGSWLLVLGAFMIVGTIASRTAHSARSLASQYMALGGFVVAEALIFVPLLVIAERQSGASIIASAGFVSLAGFFGLAAIAIFSRKDFSFMGVMLKWASFCAIGLIIAAVLFGFELGLLFSVAMVALAGGMILYSTQKIFREYPEDRYVGAALELFSSVAMLFWYVLRIFMSRD